MPTADNRIRKRLTKELATFVVLLFTGIIILPIAIWYVGDAIFGDYGGSGYWDFFGNLSAKIRTGDRVAWFLVLSPYLAISCVRLAILGWRKSSPRPS